MSAGPPSSVATVRVAGPGERVVTVTGSPGQVYTLSWFRPMSASTSLSTPGRWFVGSLVAADPADVPDPGAIVYAPGGCDACHGSGYTGQTAAFEAILADAALRRLINDGGDEAIISRHAFLNSPNLGSAARALVRSGVTTPEEAVRISRG